MKEINCFAYSQQGYNHIKADKVCQDSSGYYSDENMSIIVVADGHGSDNYPRTDRGSRFAVNAALEMIQSFMETILTENIDVSVSSTYYLEQLAKSILAFWYESVEDDYRKHPFTEEELLKVSEKYQMRYFNSQRVEKAYGTTLIAVCQTADYWIGLQIGDGRCVCIMPDGSFAEPIPWDDNCQSNVTTSICDSDAIDEFRYCCYRGECPIATFIGTDGIDDSYSGTEELHDLYYSIFRIFVEHGSDIGTAEVKEYLPKITQKGSGDDVSCAGLIPSEISSAFFDKFKIVREIMKAERNVMRLENELTVAKENYQNTKSILDHVRITFHDARQKQAAAEEAVEMAVQKLEKAKKVLANTWKTAEAFKEKR